MDYRHLAASPLTVSAEEGTFTRSGPTLAQILPCFHSNMASPVKTIWLLLGLSALLGVSRCFPAYEDEDFQELKEILAEARVCLVLHSYVGKMLNHGVWTQGM